ELFTQIRRALVASGPAAFDELRKVVAGSHPEVNQLFKDKRLDKYCGDRNDAPPDQCQPVSAMVFFPAVVLGDFYDARAVPELLGALQPPALPAYYAHDPPSPPASAPPPTRPARPAPPPGARWWGREAPPPPPRGLRAAPGAAPNRPPPAPSPISTPSSSRSAPIRSCRATTPGSTSSARSR